MQLVVAVLRIMSAAVGADCGWSANGAGGANNTNNANHANAANNLNSARQQREPFNNLSLLDRGLTSVRMTSVPTPKTSSQSAEIQHPGLSSLGA
jgi:hypothetical protein